MASALLSLTSVQRVIFLWHYSGTRFQPWSPSLSCIRNISSSPGPLPSASKQAASPVSTPFHPVSLLPFTIEAHWPSCRFSATPDLRPRPSLCPPPATLLPTGAQGSPLCLVSSLPQRRLFGVPLCLAHLSGPQPVLPTPPPCSFVPCVPVAASHAACLLRVFSSEVLAPFVHCHIPGPGRMLDTQRVFTACS